VLVLALAPIALAVALGGSVAGADCASSSSVNGEVQSLGASVTAQEFVVTGGQLLLSAPATGYSYVLHSMVVTGAVGPPVQLFGAPSNEIYGTVTATNAASSVVPGQVVSESLRVRSTGASPDYWVYLTYDTILKPSSTAGASTCEMVGVQGFSLNDLLAFCAVLSLALGVVMVRAFWPGK